MLSLMYHIVIKENFNTKAVMKSAVTLDLCAKIMINQKKETHYLCSRIAINILKIKYQNKEKKRKRCITIDNINIATLKQFHQCALSHHSNYITIFYIIIIKSKHFNYVIKIAASNSFQFHYFLLFVEISTTLIFLIKMNKITKESF